MHIMPEVAWKHMLKKGFNIDIPMLTILEYLMDTYTAEHRHYHNINHIQYMLSSLYEHEDLAEKQYHIELAIWFHDVVQAQRYDDEVLSANKFCEMFRDYLEKDDLFYIIELILNTSHRYILHQLLGMVG